LPRVLAALIKISVIFLTISIKSVLEAVNILKFAESVGCESKEKRKELYAEAEILVRRITAFKNSIKP
jgi:hypothetical protein